MNALENIVLDNTTPDVKRSVQKPKENNEDHEFSKMVNENNEQKSASNNTQKTEPKKNNASSKESIQNDDKKVVDENEIFVFIDENETDKDSISKLVENSDLDDETKEKLISLFKEDTNDNINISELNKKSEEENVNIEFVINKGENTNDKDIKSNNIEKLSNKESEDNNIVNNIIKTDSDIKNQGKQNDVNVLQPTSNNVSNVTKPSNSYKGKETDFSIKDMVEESSDEKGDIKDKNSFSTDTIADAKKKIKSNIGNNQNNSNIPIQNFSDTLETIINKDSKVNNYSNSINNNNVHTAEQHVKTNTSLHSSVLEQMNASIKKNIQGEKTEFTIKLKPIELGDINIKLEFAHDGKVQTVINVEKSDTLDMLQKDTKTLEKMLKDAGLNNNEFIFNQNKNGNSSNNEFEKTFNKNYGGNKYNIDDNSELTSRIDRNAANNYHDGLLNVVV